MLFNKDVIIIIIMIISNIATRSQKHSVSRNIVTHTDAGIVTCKIKSQYPCF